MKKIILVLLSIIYATNGFSQSDSTEIVDINMQDYSPSVLLGKGNWEYKLFNNLYTQTANFDANGNRQQNANRANYFSAINQFLYGVSPTLNVGFDLWVKSVHNGTAESSALDLFAFPNDANSRTAISGFGPKIKFAPFKNLTKLSLQSTFLIPVATDLEGKTNGQPYLSDDSYIWINQFFYDQPIGTKFQLFFQVAPWFYFKRQPQAAGVSRVAFSNPVSVFFSYYATDRISFYVQNEYWPSFGTPFISSAFLQNGIGMKYQLIKGLLEAEALYTKFTVGKNAGAGETFNVGFRLIH
ncbi:MAG: hypothetical protein AUK44_00905 [Porphyromonadaceae bacterium CG2_30_38_12]|nr:MAG: hypothetical protein AUK44_00905 [Porphyromonadaceae bacterium CG2_30_38_12]